MSIREKTIYVNQDNIGPQINLGKEYRFFNISNTSTNLNDICVIEGRAGDTLVTMLNEEVSYGKDFFETLKNDLKDDKQFFRNYFHILNLEFLERAGLQGEETIFIFNKGLSGTFQIKLGKSAWDEFNKHLDK
ncbi:MAG: hypothetical protein REH79_03145 [Spiroplasma sp.]|nr:hypothetical protein [Spiroplasma sp.]